MEPGVNDVMLTVVCGCHTRVPNPRLSTTTYLRRVTPPLSVDGFHANDTLLAVVPVTRRSVGVVGADRSLGAAAATGAENTSVDTSRTVAIRPHAAREKSPLVPMEPPCTVASWTGIRAAGRMGISRLQDGVPTWA